MIRRLPLIAAALLAALAGASRVDAEKPLPPSWLEPLRAIEPLSRTGILYDRVLPLARLELLDGGPEAPAIDAATWRQAYDELRRSSLSPAGPDLAVIAADVRAARREGVIPIALLDFAYERVRPGALDDGTLRIREGRLELASGTNGDALIASRAIAAAALVPRTWRGTDVTFALEHLATDAAPRSIALDFDDGRGLRAVGVGERVRVRYDATGSRTLRVRIVRDDGTSADARFTFDVRSLAAPLPDDTLHVTATVPFQSQFGTGEAYVYRAPGHAALMSPIVVVEGFDLDNSMNWDELYDLLNRENLLEALRADGFDAVVLNFTDSTVPVEQNGLVVAELVRQVQSLIPAEHTLALAGASMGGLCSRYALAWMETNAIPHRVRTWVSFDSPHGGADIPLGLQYWINFFSGQSAEAAAFLAILQRPAAREMLIHHFTTPPGATGVPDPLRAQLLASFAAVGDYPQQPRRVAIANGANDGDTQGFGPGAQVIRWEYTSLFVDVTGNVWAVPDQAQSTIFHGRTRILFSVTQQTIPVSGTQPWNGAPGGSRASFSELDQVAAPYGDIVALHPAHCFIPSVSALALPTTDPFFDIDGTPGLAGLTPFDAVYVPAANQEHVAITPENAVWLRSELTQGVVGIGDGPAATTVSLVASPSPFRDGVRLTWALPRPGRADLRVFDVRGREVRRLASGDHAAGARASVWDGRDAAGRRVGSGVYFVNLRGDAGALTRRIVKLD